jgi:O-antigen/teichoic acid export membrane protein
MVRVAVQQALLAALFTLLAAANPLPALQAVWIGAAAGFLLMASTTLLWRWRERPSPGPRRVVRALLAR